MDIMMVVLKIINNLVDVLLLNVQAFLKIPEAEKISIRIIFY
jgi:hypothetical protein